MNELFTVGEKKRLSGMIFVHMSLVTVLSLIIGFGAGFAVGTLF